jgi:hypothetical protein
MWVVCNDEQHFHSSFSSSVLISNETFVDYTFVDYVQGIGSLIPPLAVMDPVSASVAVGKLIGNIDKHKYQDVTISSSARVHMGDDYFYEPFNTRNSDRASHDLELKRLARQVIQEIEDSEVYISILQEVQSLFDTSSEDFPPSVKAALGSCLAHQKVLIDCRQDLVTVEEGLGGQPELKEYQKSFLEASQAFRRSVLLFRQLIIG